MAKIENEAEKAPARHVFEVLISFDGLSEGATWAQAPDAWSDRRVDVGYLRDLGEEEVPDVPGESPR